MKSHIQDRFLSELAINHVCTANNIISKIDESEIDDDHKEKLKATIREELKGLYHGNLVLFDGGSALANDGLIKIVDEDGVQLDSFLHEISLPFYEEQEEKRK